MKVLLVNENQDIRKLEAQCVESGLDEIEVIAKPPVLKFILYFLEAYQCDHVLVDYKDNKIGFNLANNLASALPRQNVIFIAPQDYKRYKRQNLNIFDTIENGLSYIKNTHY